MGADVDLNAGLPPEAEGITVVQKLGEQGSFIPGDWDALKNIIARILTAL